MTNPIKTPWEHPKADCVIKFERHYNVACAARMIEIVHESTLRRWAINGWTSFGFTLDVVCRKGHLLIPETSVFFVKEFLLEHPLPRPETPKNLREEFRQAVKSATFEYLSPRTRYSRVRNPHPDPH